MFKLYDLNFNGSKRMKIDLIMMSTLNPSGGGRETWLKNFFDEIIRLNKEIKFNLYTLKLQDENILDDVNSKLVNSHYQCDYKVGKLPIFFKFLLFILNNFIFSKKKSDHVLAVGGLNEALAVMLGYGIRGVKGKRILWLRTIYTKEKGYALNKFTQFLLLKFEIFIIKNFFDIVIANGDDTAEFYRGFGVDCIVIKNSIPLEKWNNLKGLDYKDKLKVAFIGRLSEVKGIKSFLEAINILYKNNNIEDIEFHIIGDGPYINQVEEYEKSNIVKRYGAIPNSKVPLILEEMHCCVALTYLSDFLGGGGVSNALLEQMAAGKILVCWDNNIFRHVLDNECAYFIEQGNSVALAECFLEIKNNRSEAYKKAEKVRVLSHDYSIENHVNKFFNIIEVK